MHSLPAICLEETLAVQTSRISALCGRIISHPLRACRACPQDPDREASRARSRTAGIRHISSHGTGKRSNRLRALLAALAIAAVEWGPIRTLLLHRPRLPYDLVRCLRCRQARLSRLPWSQSHPTGQQKALQKGLSSKHAQTRSRSRKRSRCALRTASPGWRSSMLAYRNSPRRKSLLPHRKTKRRCTRCQPRSKSLTHGRPTSQHQLALRSASQSGMCLLVKRRRVNLQGTGARASLGLHMLTRGLIARADQQTQPTFGAMRTSRTRRRSHSATVRIQHGHQAEAQGTRMARELAIAHGTGRATEDQPTCPRDGAPDSRSLDRIRLGGTAALAPETEAATARLRLPHQRRPAHRLARMAPGQDAARTAGIRIMAIRVMARDVVVLMVVDVRRIRRVAVRPQTTGMRLLRRQARVAYHGP